MSQPPPRAFPVTPRIITTNVPATTPISGQALAPVVQFSRAEIAKIGQASKEKVGTIADKLTATVGTTDMEGLGKSLSTLVDTAREYNPAKWNKGVFGGLFRKGAAAIDKRFKSVDKQVESLLIEVQRQISLFSNSLPDIQTMRDENEAMYRELEADINDLNSKLDYARNNLPVVDPNDPYSQQKLISWQEDIIFGEKLAADLEAHKTLCLLQDPMLRTTANNSFMLVQKFNSTRTMTIPLLKQQYGQYVIQLMQKKGAELATAIDDATEEAIRANATMLRQNSAAIATANTRAIISVDTLEHSYNELEAGLKEVQQIYSDMQTRIKNDAPRIAALNAKAQQL